MHIFKSIATFGYKYPNTYFFIGVFIGLILSILMLLFSGINILTLMLFGIPMVIFVACWVALNIISSELTSGR